MYNIYNSHIEIKNSIINIIKIKKLKNIKNFKYI